MANPTRPRAAVINSPGFSLQGLGTRIFLATATVIVVVLGGALLLTKRGADQAADDSVARALSAGRSAVQDALDSRSRVLLQVTGVQARFPAYIAQLSLATENSGADLLDRAGEFRDQAGASWALITGPAGVALAWTLHLDAAGEDFSEGAVVGQALEGESTQGVWIEPAGAGDVLYQAVGVPVKDPNSQKIYGVVVTALAIDTTFIKELKRHTGSEIAFFDRDSTGAPHVSLSTLPKAPLDRALTGLALDSIFSDTTHRSFHLTADDEEFVGVLGPLRTADGHVVAGFAALRSRGAELAAYTALRRTMIVVFGAGLVLALLSALLVARQVTQPVRRLVALTRAVSDGQYPERFDIESRGEVGELASAFQRMLADLKQKQELVDYLSLSAGATPTVKTPIPGPSATQRLSTPTPVTGQLRPGALLAERYEIKELLGAGGMGVVYRAWDRQLQEPVAIKTLRPEALTADGTTLERFKQEIKLARRISHRHVLRTHDLGEVDGMYYITMEYAEGTSLADLLARRGALPVGVTLAIGKQLCRALEVAHEAGVIHRDIKPQNLMIDAAGSLKVMDFGIARLHESGRTRNAALTEQGTMIGTPEYMSPEQLMADEVDGRTDLYAAGAVLFECLCGRRVFVEPTVTALIAAHLQDAPPDPRLLNSEVPDELALIILKALAKNRDDRYGSAEAMYQALERV
ncbi:MAG: protein kinase [Gemmatimonadota bacterium]